MGARGQEPEGAGLVLFLPLLLCLLPVEGTGRKQPRSCSGPLSGALTALQVSLLVSMFPSPIPRERAEVGTWGWGGPVGCAGPAWQPCGTKGISWGSRLSCPCFPQNQTLLVHTCCRRDPLHETRLAKSLLGVRALPLPSRALKICLFCIGTVEGWLGSTAAWTKPCCGGSLLPLFKGFAEIPVWKQIPTSWGTAGWDFGCCRFVGW